MKDSKLDLCKMPATSLWDVDTTKPYAASLAHLSDLTVISMRFQNVLQNTMILISTGHICFGKKECLSRVLLKQP